MSLPILTIQKGRERSLHNRHPWIYSGAVGRMPEAREGQVVDVRDHSGRRLGYGFFSPESQITCRVFHYTDQNLDVLAPEYWHAKLASAWRLRQQLVADQGTDAFRLVNAEGDFFPGLIADVYGKTAVLQLLIRGTEELAPAIADGLRALGIEHIFLKTKSVSQRIEKVELEGWLGEPGQALVEFVEDGCRFVADIEGGQKTGFFLDQRDSRMLAARMARGKKVLNTFSYSGGFSVHALRAGAELVHSVDSSAQAIELCERNVALNPNADRHQSFCQDVFQFMGQMREDYDLIILDPPAFAKTAKAVAQASRGYKDLNMRAFRKIKPGGIVFTFSCSQKIDRDLFRKIVFSAAADAGRDVRILHQTTQPPDHPINIYHPENEYLKGLVLQVE